MSLTKRNLEKYRVVCEFCGQEYYEPLGHKCPDELDYYYDREKDEEIIDKLREEEK